MKASRLFFASLGLVALAANSLGWNATGHMVVADIALRSLKPSVRAEAERLLKIGGTPETADFLTAAVWADDTRTRQNGPWHYIDLFFRKDGKTTNLKPDEENVVWAIDKFQKILADKSKPDAERADALRFILHFVGDIHQPLHTVALVSDQFPNGDKGGNDYAVEPRVAGGRRPKNLHSLWDGGAGLFPRIERPLTSEGQAEVDAIATKALAMTSAAQIKSAVKQRDPMKWALEGEALAHDFVYSTPDGQVPSAAYITQAQSVSATRVALAGSRLADLLNRTIK